MKLPAGITISAFSLLTCVSAATGANCDTPFQAAFRPEAEVRMDLRSGDIDITGADTAAVRVVCEVKAGESAKDITVEFNESGNSGVLRIHGGPKDSVRLRIQVPTNTNLVVQSTAGDVDISGIRGNKDISLRAGDLTIQVPDHKEYGVAEASVTAGDIDASAFNVHKGGLFRSFKHSNAGGKYKLKAKLWAGDIKLRP